MHNQVSLEDEKKISINSKVNIDEIKFLYKRLKNKIAFCSELSSYSEIETSEKSIYNHWFGSFWAIPEKHQDLVLTKLKEKQSK